MKRMISLVALVALGLGLPLLATEEESEQTAGSVKRVQMTLDQMRLRSGAEMYQSFCATCHGVDGKGLGPAASALAMRCPDLTRLATDNGGEFPRVRTLNEILRDRETVAHGSKDMPVWGEVFRATSSPAHARHRAWVLMKYVESFQVQEESDEESRPG